MKKKILGALLSVLLLAVIIVAMAPAQTVWPLIASKLPAKFQKVQTTNIQGSIWNPKIGKIRYYDLSVENVSADISVLSLLTGNLKAQINVNDFSLKLDGKLSANTNAIEVSNLNYELAAQRFDPFMQFPVKSLKGNLTGSIEQASLQANGNWNNVQGIGSWQNAIIDYLEQSLALGNFEYQIKTDDTNNIILTVVDNQGVLDLKGQLTLMPNRSYQLDVSTQTQLPTDLENWIKNFGKLENDRYRIQWSGKL
ncbi:MAG: type II secretion system protein N [Gammaproteobacteria bacterium]|nr:type II secretion system protein N [Gammaproteobacteria bacterium]